VPAVLVFVATIESLHNNMLAGLTILAENVVNIELATDLAMIFHLPDAGAGKHVWIIPQKSP